MLGVRYKYLLRSRPRGISVSFPLFPFRISTFYISLAIQVDVFTLSTKSRTMSKGRSSRSFGKFSIGDPFTPGGMTSHITDIQFLYSLQWSRYGQR
jgi:hypothetical protein